MAAKNKFMNAMKMPAIADMFSSEADRQRESGDLVTEVPLSELHPFVNHPFEVRDDEDMNFGLPASKLVDTTAFEAKAPYNKYFVEALETAVPYPTNLNGSAFQTMFQKECESLWAGAITPEEFETRVDEQAAEILNK